MGKKNLFVTNNFCFIENLYNSYERVIYCPIQQSSNQKDFFDKRFEELKKVIPNIEMGDFQFQEGSDYLCWDALNEIKVSKNIISSINQPSIVPNNTTAEKSLSENLKSIKSGIEIKSPIIGTAYHAPEPGAKKFVEIGKKIKKGDTIMIVEAMKTMNHVPSLSDGVVKEICIDDGQPVEFGQTLIVLE